MYRVQIAPSRPASKEFRRSMLATFATGAHPFQSERNDTSLLREMQGSDHSNAMGSLLRATVPSLTALEALSTEREGRPNRHADRDLLPVIMAPPASINGGQHGGDSPPSRSPSPDVPGATQHGCRTVGRGPPILLRRGLDRLPVFPRPPMGLV